MAIRGTLISPTNILLEHPLFQCVDGPKFVILAKKEYERDRKNLFKNALYLGLAAGAVLLFSVVAVILAVWK